MSDIRKPHVQSMLPSTIPAASVRSRRSERGALPRPSPFCAGTFWHEKSLIPTARRIKFLIMVTTLQVEQMSRTEKLQVMETIWAALSVPDSEMESPVWHADALRETEDRVRRGEERIVDWEVAKRELRNRFE